MNSKIDNIEQSIISACNISKDYIQGRSCIEVLKNINLNLAPGELVSIIGASGSGKSTLLHIIGLLDIQDSGTLTINSISNQLLFQKNNTHKIRLKNMGFVYQHHHLLRDLTAQENAAMTLLIQGIKTDEAMERAAELLSELGLGSRLFNVPGELSGGEQQRVAIARALIHNPQIILADEPTGNLDPNTSEVVFEMLLNHASEHKTAIVMVSHNLKLAHRMDKIYELRYGQLST